ncbi:RDD family protein [Nocardioides dilutus]
MTTAAPTAPPAAGAGLDLVPAGLDRRFYAFVLDRLLLWSLYAAAAAGAYAWFLRDERWLPGLAVVAGAVLLLVLASAAGLGLWGVSAGKATLGLRVVDVEDGRPIGVPRALLRTLLLGVATLPTFGFGAAALAWTAVADPAGRRRGWHDLRARCWVVDVRPPQEPTVVEVEQPRPVVNLTAMRLVPQSPTPPARPPSLPVPHDPDASAAVSPRQGLGWPLVGGTPDGSGPPPAAEPVPSAPGRRVRQVSRWRVRFDTGEELDVGGLVLVGRRPEPRPGEPVGTLLALASADMSLSKTHAQFQVVPDGALVVMDRGSTNGSVLVRGGLYKRLDGGRPATLKHGDRVRFGDREMTVARLDHQ